MNCNYILDSCAKLKINYFVQISMHHTYFNTKKERNIPFSENWFLTIIITTNVIKIFLGQCIIFSTIFWPVYALETSCSFFAILRWYQLLSEWKTILQNGFTPLLSVGKSNWKRSLPQDSLSFKLIWLSDCLDKFWEKMDELT